MAKFKHTKHGLAGDPRGAHVVLKTNREVLLGEVRDAYRDDITGAIRLRVRFMNGEPWPIDPTSRAVEVLERDTDGLLKD